MSDFANLKEAVINGSKEQILELLKDEDIDVKTITDDKGDTLLHLAFRNASFDQQQLIEILQIFLDRGNDINVKNKLGRTILHIAVERRMRDVVDFCLRRGADMNPRHKRRNSIAHFAIEEICRAFPKNALENTTAFQSETSSFVDWMVSRGFDFFHTKNCHNMSPFYWANDFNVQHILLTLLRRVDNLPAVEEGQTPLLRAFLEKDAGQQRIEHGWSGALNSIHPMCYQSRYTFDIVKIILEKNRSIDEKTLDSALRLAIESKQKIYVIEILAQRLTNVNPRIGCDEALIKIFANSFQANDWSAKDNMAILKSLIMKGADAKGRGTVINKTLAQKLFTHHPTMEMLKILKEARADFNLSSINPKENFLFLISKFGLEAGMIDFVVSRRNNRSVNITNTDGETPLLTAIVAKNENAAMELIRFGAKVNVKDSRGRSLLAMACQRSEARVLEKMIEYGANLKYRNEDGRTLLHLSVHRPKIVELLLKNGVNVNAKDNNGQTALDFAMTDRIDNDSAPLAFEFKKGQTEVLDNLIEYGAELNNRDKNGRTLLHLAVKYPKVIELLLKNGLDVNARDNSGSTALAMACKIGQTKVVETLIEHGAGVDYRDENNKTLLHLVVNYPNLVDLLINKGLNVNAKDKDDKTPLAIACEIGPIEVQEKLMEHGADLDYRDNDGKTLLHLAANRLDVSDSLLKKGLDVNAKDSYGKTPLHYALIDGVVKKLVNCGARVDAVDKDGNTPLYDALTQKKTISIDELIRSGADVKDPKVFQFAIKQFEEPYTVYVPLKLRYLKRHLIKMTAVGLLNEMPHTRNGLEEELLIYYERYKHEVELMKTCFVDDCTSLYDLLYKDPNSRCAYVDNETLKSFLEDVANRKKFYNYFDMIQGFYNQAATRKSLLKLASSILNQLTKMNLPNSCTHLIFLHLSNVDIVRLIQVYEDSICSKSTDRSFRYSSNNLLPIIKRERI